MVYADSPHIHLQQSVANQSKVKDNRSKEYSKSTEQREKVLDGLSYRTRALQMHTSFLLGGSS